MQILLKVLDCVKIRFSFISDKSAKILLKYYHYHYNQVSGITYCNGDRIGCGSFIFSETRAAQKGIFQDSPFGASFYHCGSLSTNNIFTSIKKKRRAPL